MNFSNRFASRLHAAALVAACAALAAACADGDYTSPLAPEAQRQVGAANGSAAADAQLLARIFASAMKDADVRIHLRNAMRASELTEHKLVLQEFASTRGGRRLVEAAAQASGKTVAEVDALIASLPEMDFYAPFAEHRRTWNGSADVAVGAAIDVDGTRFLAFTADGGTVSHASASAAPKLAWLFLHPAEPKSRRPNPQASTPGAVIQDPDDGTVGTMNLPGEPCTDACDGGGTPTTMVLESIYTNVFDGIGAAELRFIVSNNAGQELGAHTFDGIDADAFRVKTVNYTLPRGPVLTVREIDTWDSDPKGTYPITAIPGTVYAENVNCYWHYYDNRGHDGAEQMCGPESYREEYTRMIPHWSAKLK